MRSILALFAAISLIACGVPDETDSLPDETGSLHQAVKLPGDTIPLQGAKAYCAAQCTACSRAIARCSPNCVEWPRSCDRCLSDDCHTER